MKLSIITINYNNVDGLKKTIDSIVCQTWRDFEWIIIDGGSTDGSKELIEQVAAEEKNNVTYWCSEPDKGIYNAMNKGIDKAKGEWLNFMNSGDGFYENCTLENVFMYDCCKEEIYDIMYGDSMYEYIDHVEKRTFPENISFSHFIYGHINHQATFYKLKLFQSSKYDESYSIVADLKKNLECLRDNRRFVHVPVTISLFDKSGISEMNNIKVKEETARIYQELFSDYFISDIKELADLKIEIEHYKTKEKQILNSWSYRLGHLILQPVFLCRKIFK